MSAGALIARLNFALDLVSGRIAQLQFAPEQPTTAPPENADALIDAIAMRFDLDTISAGTRRTLLDQLAAPADGGMASTGKKAQLAALVLGSPEFQRR